MFKKEILLEDVCNETFINNLYNLEKMSPEEIDDLFLSMSIGITNNDKQTEFNLINNGNNIAVTKNNIKQYIKSVIKYYTFEYTSSPLYKNMQAFVDGFEKLYLNISNHNEKVCIGQNKLVDSRIIAHKIFKKLNIFTIDKDEIINDLHFSAESRETSKLIIEEYMKYYLNNLSQKKIKKFLEFTTSFDHYTGEYITCQISKNINKIPTTATCYRTIYVPSCLTYDSFKNKMDIALYNFSGFQYL